MTLKYKTAQAIYFQEMEINAQNDSGGLTSESGDNVSGNLGCSTLESGDNAQGDSGGLTSENDDNAQGDLGFSMADDNIQDSLHLITRNERDSNFSDLSTDDDNISCITNHGDLYVQSNSDLATSSGSQGGSSNLFTFDNIVQDGSDLPTVGENVQINSGLITFGTNLQGSIILDTIYDIQNSLAFTRLGDIVQGSSDLAVVCEDIQDSSDLVALSDDIQGSSDFVMESNEIKGSLVLAMVSDDIQDNSDLAMVGEVDQGRADLVTVCNDVQSNLYLVTFDNDKKGGSGLAVVDDAKGSCVDLVTVGNDIQDGAGVAQTNNGCFSGVATVNDTSSASDKDHLNLIKMVATAGNMYHTDLPTTLLLNGSETLYCSGTIASTSTDDDGSRYNFYFRQDTASEEKQFNPSLMTEIPTGNDECYTSLTKNTSSAGDSSKTIVPTDEIIATVPINEIIKYATSQQLLPVDNSCYSSLHSKSSTASSDCYSTLKTEISPVVDQYAGLAITTTQNRKDNDFDGHKEVPDRLEKPGEYNELPDLLEKPGVYNELPDLLENPAPNECLNNIDKSIFNSTAIRSIRSSSEYDFLDNTSRHLSNNSSRLQYGRLALALPYNERLGDDVKATERTQSLVNSREDNRNSLHSCAINKSCAAPSAV